jgi:two-component system chemotaxis sensor kinase CheA
MEIDLTRFRGAFFDEAGDRVAELEEGLLELESGSDPELLHRVFRAAHSVKGSAGIFGLATIGRVAHALETALDRMRAGALAPEPAAVRALLEGADLLRALIAGAKVDAPEPEGVSELVVALEALGAEPVRAPVARAEAAGAPIDFRVRFSPHEGFFAQGLCPSLLLRELATSFTLVSVRADATRLPPLAELDPETAYLAYDVVVRGAGSPDAIRQVFVFVEDACDLEIESIAPEPLARAAIAHEAAASAPRAAPELVAPTAASPAREAAALAPRATSIRVPTTKVDKIMDLVGELVITQSMIVELMDRLTPATLPLLRDAMAAMDRHTRELQERVMAVRMVPVGTVLSRFPRLVHDLSASLGKQIALTIEGEDTEIDKGIVEQLGDPLAHLVRNSADHGVEPAPERALAGKPSEGAIALRAFHQGGSVVIEIEDDGRGLDTAAILRQALAAGLVQAGDALTDEAIHELIFQPGFSTKAEVTDVSGRGVGLDVVKRAVERLNGSLQVSSTRGRGSRFRLALPLTLAIVDGLSLRVGAQSYIVPLASIVESFRPEPAQVRTVLHQGEVVMVRGGSIPLVRLSRVFDVPTDVIDPARGIVVLAESASGRAALLVDELLGQSQVVVKSTEASFRKIEGVMGATILGDGRVALILDVQGLVRLGLGEGRRAHATSAADNSSKEPSHGKAFSAPPFGVSPG